MKIQSPQLLLAKVLLLFSPFVILFIIYICVNKMPDTVQYEVLNEKIRKLVLENPKNPYVLVTGESRAARVFQPQFFDEVTHVPSINVAAGGVLLPTAVKALEENGLLDKKHFIVISVSSFEINDNYMSYHPTDWDVIVNEAWGRERVKHILTFYRSLIWYYLDGFRGFLRFWQHEDTSISPDVLAQGGYMPNSGQIHVEADGTTHDIDYTLYMNPKLDGVKKIEFEKSLMTLCQSGTPAAIYLGPIAPAWRASMASIGADAVESEFADFMTSFLKAKSCSNVHFIDFAAHPIDSLDNSKFVDFVHENESGGEIFSRLLGETLITDGYLRKPATPSPGQ